MEVYLGTVILWAGRYIPEGWAHCNGQILTVREHMDLFAVIGNTYGGIKDVNFALPNLLNRIPMCDDGKLWDSEGKPNGANPPGAVSGNPTCEYTAKVEGSVTIGIDNLPKHTHTATFKPGSGNTVTTTVNVAIPAVSVPPAVPAAVNVPGPTVSLATTSVPNSRIYSAAVPTDTTLKPFPATGSLMIPAGSGTVVNDTAGEGKAFPLLADVPVKVSTLQPSLSLIYIIAIRGEFPPRA